MPICWQTSLKFDEIYQFVETLALCNEFNGKFPDFFVLMIKIVHLLWRFGGDF